RLMIWAVLLMTTGTWPQQPHPRRLPGVRQRMPGHLPFHCQFPPDEFRASASHGEWMHALVSRSEDVVGAIQAVVRLIRQTARSARQRCPHAAGERTAETLRWLGWDRGEALSVRELDQERDSMRSRAGAPFLQLRRDGRPLRHRIRKAGTRTGRTTNVSSN